MYAVVADDSGDEAASVDTSEESVGGTLSVWLGTLGDALPPSPKEGEADPYVSKCGGEPVWMGRVPAAVREGAKAGGVCCETCDMPLFLVAQIYAPVDFARSLYIYGCNSPSCSVARVEGAMVAQEQEGELSGVAAGSWRVFRSQVEDQRDVWGVGEEGVDAAAEAAANGSKKAGAQPGEEDRGSVLSFGASFASELAAAAAAAAVNPGGLDSGGGEGGGGVLGGGSFASAFASAGDTGMDDLDALLAARDASLDAAAAVAGNTGSGVTKDEKKKLKKETKNGGKKKSKANKEGRGEEEEEEDEQEEGRRGEGSSGKVDGGCLPSFAISSFQEPEAAAASGGSKKAARGDRADELAMEYLKGEADAAGDGDAKDGSGVTSVAAAGPGDRYERLPIDQRFFFRFKARVARCPSQILRYAYGGSELLPAPLPLVKAKKRKKGKSQAKSQSQSQSQFRNDLARRGKPRIIAPRCACGAERVFELQLMPQLLSALDVDGDGGMGAGAGGMDFASVYVYSCAESCGKSDEEWAYVLPS